MHLVCWQNPVSACNYGYEKEEEPSCGTTKKEFFFFFNDLTPPSYGRKNECLTKVDLTKLFS